jgi:hypothetical protein
MNTSLLITLSHIQRQRLREYKRLRAILLRIRSSLRVRNIISSSSLSVVQEQSPWYVIYSKRDVHTFISVVSTPPLLIHFDRHYIVKSGPGRRVRPLRIVPNTLCLHLFFLHFYMHATGHKTFCKLFAVVSSTFSRVLKNAAEMALGKILAEVTDAAVKWPSIALRQRWAKMTNDREPLVELILAFVDGKNFRVQQAPNPDLQNAIELSVIEGIFFRSKNRNIR